MHPRTLFNVVFNVLYNACNASISNIYNAYRLH